DRGLVCSISSTPIARHGTITPGYDFSSHAIMASSGSPSGARVENTNPQSYGYVRPAGSGRESSRRPTVSSYVSLTDEPRGVATSTLIEPSARMAGVVNWTIRPPIECAWGLQYPSRPIVTETYMSKF